MREFVTVRVSPENRAIGRAIILPPAGQLPPLPFFSGRLPRFLKRRPQFVFPCRELENLCPQPRSRCRDRGNSARNLNPFAAFLNPFAANFSAFARIYEVLPQIRRRLPRFTIFCRKASYAKLPQKCAKCARKTLTRPVGHPLPSDGRGMG